MKVLNRVLYTLAHPYSFLTALVKRSWWLKYLSDEKALRLWYWLALQKRLNLKNPQTFNEKMQWLKLHDRKPIYTTMADKYAAKIWAASIIGEQYIIPTYGVWENANDIDWQNLPNQVVVKCNHGYGGLTGIVICKDKFNINIAEANKRLNDSLFRDYYYTGAREWSYKDIQPCILAEKYLGENLQDFRVYCFNGKPKMIYSYRNVAQADGTKPHLSSCDIFDCDWKPMPFHQKTLPCGNIDRPEHLKEMLDIAEKLSKDTPFLRVDFYEGEHLYLGELTFYPGAGMSTFYPSKWDEILGSWIDLSTIKNA